MDVQPRSAEAESNQRAGKHRPNSNRRRVSLSPHRRLEIGEGFAMSVGPRVLTTALLIRVGLIAAAAVTSSTAQPPSVSTASVNQKIPPDHPAKPPIVLPPPPLPAETADRCGRWSSRALSGSLAVPAAAQFGEIRNCLRLANVWVVTTLGVGGLPGAVGTFACQDAGCLDGRHDHPFPGWTFYMAPFPGGVTLLSVPSGGARLIVSNGGHQLVFDLVLRKYVLTGATA